MKLREKMKAILTHKEKGLDGILVTIGLCIISLLLCVILKDRLADFIEVVVESMTTRAKEILADTGLAIMPFMERRFF